MLEPVYPVAFEDIVSLYRAVDRHKLQAHRSEIISLFRQNKALVERATRYITAAGSLLQDSMRVALSCTDTAKARAFAGTLSRRYISSSGEAPHEEIRLLSALTLQGIIFYSNTIAKLADTIVVLDDEYGAASRTLLYALREEALQKGHNIVTCYCSMSPYEKIEHLFIPALRLCFVTSNSYHPIQFSGQRTIHCTRFCNKEGLKLRRKRLHFNKRAVDELFAQASSIQKEAKECHDALEQYYIDAAAIFKTPIYTFEETQNERPGNARQSVRFSLFKATSLLKNVLLQTPYRQPAPEASPKTRPVLRPPRRRAPAQRPSPTQRSPVDCAPLQSP